MALALIKGRNAIDRGEISPNETERWRERGKERERRRLPGCSDQARVCVSHWAQISLEHTVLLETLLRYVKGLQLLVQR